MPRRYVVRSTRRPRKGRKYIRRARKGGKSLIAKIAKKVAKKVMNRSVETKQSYLEPTGAGFNTQLS